MTYDVEMNSPMAERAVLACCLQSKMARDASRERLTDSDFYSPHHERMWAAMNRLDAQGMEVDPVSVLAVVRGDDVLVRLLPDLMTYPVSDAAVATHCAEVRNQAQRRRVYAETLRVQQLCLNPDVDPLGLAASTATRFADIRDVGATSDDIEAMTVEELMLEVEEEPDWVVPGLFERGDRLILTGGEGSGKSHALRQIVVLSQAGLHPFRPTERLEKPVRGMVIDFENSRRQVRRRIADTYGYALRGKGAPGLATVLCMQRQDITADKTLNKIHRELDATRPDILVIGPLYRMSPKALQSDDEAGPVLAALDTIRDRGIVLLIEAHAGHTVSHGRTRDLRPRGSSALMGWPEFGYGMKRNDGDTASLVPWRGDREAREIPLTLHSQDGMWVERKVTTVQDLWRPKEDWSDLNIG